MPKKIFRYLITAVISAFSLLGALYVLLMIKLAINGSHTGHTKQKRAQIILMRLDQAISEYRSDIGHFPERLNDLVTDTNDLMWMGSYIKEKELKDPWGEDHHYHLIHHANGYQLFTLGADHAEGGQDHQQDQLSKGSLFIIKPK